MNRARLLWTTPAVGLTLVLGGCSGGSAPSTSSSPSVSTSPEPAAGQSVPEALRAFTCQADDDGAWSATGMLANTSRSTHTYAVTAQVGPADGESASAKRVRVTVSPRSTAPFSLTKLPTSSPDGPCHLRVLVVD